MKIVLIILAIVSCIFINTAEGAQEKKLTNQQLIQINHQALYANCCEISKNVFTRFHAPGYKGSPYRSWQTVAKQEITYYLRSIGTAAARQLLKELEAGNFRGVV